MEVTEAMIEAGLAATIDGEEIDFAAIYTAMRALEPRASSDGVVKALKAADDALRNYACHGGPSVPCIRSPEQCRSECGKPAGDALLLVESALQSQPRASSDGVVELAVEAADKTLEGSYFVDHRLRCAVAEAIRAALATPEEEK